MSPTEQPGDARKQAERWLAAARQSGDRAREASALADLGASLLNEGDAPAAITALESCARAEPRAWRSCRESDVVGNLGTAALAVGQPAQSRPMFEQSLRLAREAGNHFSEKLALERLGIVCGNMGDFSEAIAYFEQALNLVRRVGDRQQQANLLWQQAIQCAELGQRQVAIAKADEAVAILKFMGRPQAGWYESHLQRYRAGRLEQLAGAAGGVNGADGSSGDDSGGSIVATVTASQFNQGTAAARKTDGPGLLRMAISATKAMAKFVGSGSKTTPNEIQRQRLATCAGCEHHTGLRCKICGCFTNSKSRMLHEDCPIGKWTA